MASSAFTIQDGSASAVNATSTVRVTPGNTVTIALNSTSGVTSWRTKCTYSDSPLMFTPPGPNVPAAAGLANFQTGTPTSWTFTAPSTPCTITLLSAADDGSGTVAPVSCSIACGLADSSNWVQCTNVSTIVNQAAPSGLFFAAALLKVKASGIFEVCFDLGWSCGTTADSVTLAFLTDTSAAGTLTTAGTKAAVGIAGPGITTSDMEIISAGTNTLQYNGATFTTAPITHKSEVNVTLTGLLSGSAQKFNYRGLVHNANGTTRTPFTVGNTVAFGLKVTATNTVTFPMFDMYVRELAG